MSTVPEPTAARSAGPAAHGAGERPGEGPPPGERPSAGGGRLRVLRRASVAGMVLAVAIHLAIFIIAEFIVVGGGAPGEGASEDPGFDFAVMTEQEFARFQERSLDAGEPEAPDVETQEPVAEELLQASDSIDASPVPDGLENVAPSVGGGDLGDGAALGGGGTGGGASFFGVEAAGRRFAYIVDTSGSMSRDRKWETTRAALLTSIANLLGNSEFYVVLYNSDAWPLAGRSRWVEASERGKKFARTSVQSISPSGSTRPLPAFTQVFALDPEPDAIYFMTDGEFDSRIASEIISLNRRHRVTIHCITFVNDESENLMRNIASSSGGTYKHVPGSGQ